MRNFKHFVEYVLLPQPSVTGSEVIALFNFAITRPPLYNLLLMFCRLTPIYMVVMMSYAFMYRYIGDGPTWASHIELADTCRERWWYHILYVNNLVGTDGHTAFQQVLLYKNVNK
jgi:hypothetical protein